MLADAKECPHCGAATSAADGFDPGPKTPLLSRLHDIGMSAILGRGPFIVGSMAAVVVVVFSLTGVFEMDDFAQRLSWAFVHLVPPTILGAVLLGVRRLRRKPGRGAPKNG